MKSCDPTSAGGLRSVRQLLHVRQKARHGIYQRGTISGLETCNLLVLRGDQGLPIELRVLKRPAEARCILELVGKAACIDEEFFWNATADDACAADPIFLSDRYACAVACCDACRANATRSRTDDEKVVVEFRHEVEEAPATSALATAVVSALSSRLRSSRCTSCR